MSEKEKAIYFEPANYFPEEIRKECKLGEYNDDYYISFEDAKRIAKEWNNKYDTCQEYEDAYSFFIDDGVIHDGGPDNCLIIEKATGKTIPVAVYVLSGQYDPVEVGEPFKMKEE